MKKITPLLCFCFLLIQSAKAQQDFLMYNMNDIPQSSYSNPSNQFNGTTFVGLPVLSSTYYSVSNSGFAYSDAIKKDGDSLLLDFPSLIKELRDENFTSFNMKIDLFSIGFQLGKRTQLSVNITENANFRFNYTKDLVRFVYEGNGAFEDNTANFENIGINANYYREYGLNISHQFTNRLRLGTRLKYLYGVANINSEKTDLRLTTDPNNFNLTAQADVNINTSGIDNFSDTERSDFISGRDNTGFGIDFGANYELNKKLSFNASVLDIGYIDWNSNNKNFTIPNGEYTYRGIEIDAFTSDGDTTGDTSFDRILDSLEQAFDVTETNEGYTTPLVTRIYLGANYKLNERVLLGGLLQSEFFKGRVKPSFTASANFKANKWVTLAASLTAINHTYNNLGVGININPGPVQFYVVSDNLLSALQPQHARHAQVRFGINFIIGSKKTKEIRPSFDGVTFAKKEKKKEEKEEEKEENQQSEETESEQEEGNEVESSSEEENSDDSPQAEEPIEEDNTEAEESTEEEDNIEAEKETTPEVTPDSTPEESTDPENLNENNESIPETDQEESTEEDKSEELNESEENNSNTENNPEQNTESETEESESEDDPE